VRPLKYTRDRRRVLPETASNRLLEWNRVSQVQGVGWKFRAVWERVKVWSRDTDELPNDWGVRIHRSVVNSSTQGWALTGPLVQDLYRLTMANEMPKSLWGEQLETYKASALPKPLSLCVCLPVW
jgi:hypothetical protein